MKALIPALLIAFLAPGAGAAENLAARVSAASKSGTPVWLTWSVPSAIDGNACCWDNRDSSHSRSCSLSSNNWGTNVSDGDGRPSDPTLIVYAHVSGGDVDKVRTYSASCRVDRTGENVQDLSGITPAESVTYLATLVKSSEGDREAKRRSDGALSAIAMHDDRSADAVLERVAKEGETKQLRHSAAFWLGNTRERAGYDALVRLRNSDDASFREHLTFCFSQSKVAEAPATLIDMAKNDPSSRVRGQALFWIAQKARKKADADVIRAAADNDPDVEIKKKAVFALSQIPNGEGVPDLIRVAQENKSREVRKQAMFWLGQSKDPRALAFFEKILTQ